MNFSNPPENYWLLCAAVPYTTPGRVQYRVLGSQSSKADTELDPDQWQARRRWESLEDKTLLNVTQLLFSVLRLCTPLQKSSPPEVCTASFPWLPASFVSDSTSPLWLMPLLPAQDPLTLWSRKYNPGCSIASPVWHKNCWRRTLNGFNSHKLDRLAASMQMWYVTAAFPISSLSLNSGHLCSHLIKHLGLLMSLTLNQVLYSWRNWGYLLYHCNAVTQCI